MLKRFCNCILPTRHVGGLNLKWDHIDNTVPVFSLAGQTHVVKVVDVYDGDSIKIVIHLSGTFHKFNCRLSGIDTPEMRSKDLTEKLYAHYVKKKVKEHLLNQMVIVDCEKFDKYGRLLIWLSVNNPEINIPFNQYIINQEWGIKYDGKTKKLWSTHLKQNPQLMRRKGVIP